MSMTDDASVDFDHHAEEFFDNRHEKWAELRKCPVAHNSHYGGFWIVSGYDEVAVEGILFANWVRFFREAWVSPSCPA